VFNHRTDRHGVYRFLHTTTGNDSDHNGTSSDETVTDPIADAAQGRKEKSAEDRGWN
jgi:hypothetical protein